MSYLTFLNVCSLVVHCLLINIAQASASEKPYKIHSNIVENIPFHRKPLLDIDPKDMELFEAVIREEKEIKPKLFTCMNVTRKATHNLPFVRIRGYFISPQSDEGPFCGRQDFDCMALYDTGAEWTVVCAESYGVKLQSGVSQALVINFQ
jgi:hypothetical protein